MQISFQIIQSIIQGRDNKTVSTSFFFLLCRTYESKIKLSLEKVIVVTAIIFLYHKEPN